MEGSEGIGLSFGPVEGSHQMEPQALAERMGSDQGLELRNELPMPS